MPDGARRRDTERERGPAFGSCRLHAEVSHWTSKAILAKLQSAGRQLKPRVTGVTVCWQSLNMLDWRSGEDLPESQWPRRCINLRRGS